MRNGSYTSSTVSGCSPTLMARVDSPTGPPPNCWHTVVRMARSTLSSPSSSTPNRASPSRAVATIDRAVAPNLREVTHPAQEAVGDAGRAPAAPGDLPAPASSIGDAEDAGRARDDGLELVGRVVVEPGDEAEPVAERAGEEPGAGRGADEGEARQA